MARAWLGLVLLLAWPAWATVFRSGSTVTIPPNEVINDDLVVSGSTINLQGRVTGDLVAAGSTVNVDGPVAGNLIVAAGTVTVSDPVGGSMYAAAGTVNLNASVGRNLVSTGGTTTLGPSGTVARDATLSGGTVTVQSAIGRHLRASAGELTLGDQARVGGDLTAQAGQHRIADGAVIEGQQQITRDGAQRGFSPLGWLGWQLFVGIALLLAGLIFVALAPRLTEETETALRTRPWLSLAVGAVILLIGLPLFILLLITVIGIPLAFIWAWVYLTAVFLSPIFVAILVGRLVWRRPGGSLFLALAIGVGLLVLVRLVPLLGFLVTLAAILFGLGALALALYDRGKRRRAAAETRPEAPPQAPPEAPPQAA